MPGKGFLHGYLPYLLQRADHLMSAAFHGWLMREGVQVSEWRVLAVLADHGSLSVQEVANIALLHQPTASHACRRLEEAGLLSSEESDEDRRKRILTLTDEGRIRVGILIATAKDFEQQVLQEVSPASDTLAGQLRSLIDQLDSGR